MTFSFDSLPLFLSLLSLSLILIFKKRRGKKREETLFLSKISPLSSYSHLGRAGRAHLPRFCAYMALLHLVLAWIDPRIEGREEDRFERREKQEESSSPKKQERVSLPTEGIALYFLLDQSPSMQEEMKGSLPSLRQRMSRLDFLKELTARLIEGSEPLGLRGRREDLVGVIAFARFTRVLSPLTLHHGRVVEKLRKLQLVRRKEEVGTAIGYALFKTAHLIQATRQLSQELADGERPAYEILNQVIILVTDGIQNTLPEDAQHKYRALLPTEAAREAKRLGIRIYIVNVDPEILQPELRKERIELEEAAELTGGKFFVAREKEQLLGIYREIDQLEKSQLPEQREALLEGNTSSQASVERFFSPYPWLIGLGATFLFLSLLLETTWLRRFP